MTSPCVRGTLATVLASGVQSEEALRVQALIQEREAQGVRAAMAARILFSAAGLLSLPFTATIPSDLVRTSVACGIGIGIGVVGYRLARSPTFTTKVGLVGVGFDVAMLMLMPWSWYAAVGGAAVPASFLAKTEIVIIAGALVAINTLTLRPFYPLTVALAGALTQLGLLLYGLADPRTTTTANPLETHMGPAVHVGFVVWNIFALAMTGAFLAAVASAARRMIWRAAEAEIESAHLRAQEAQRIAAAKLSGLSGLVAGLAHEINTPLGALVSGADSAATIQRRIRERIEAAESLAGLRSDRGLDRALQALGSTSSASREAGARIHALVSALKSFAHLDRGEFEEVDLREGLESTMALIPAELLGDAKIIREYGDVPRVRCRVREVNQVFMTLVENALEAMGGQGELTLTVRKDHRDLCVEIQDTGPGISPEVQREIFDLRFHRDKKRVGMGLGLPVGRKVILEHGGDLEVRSRPGRGATFTVRIPGPEASLPLHSGMDTAARR